MPLQTSQPCWATLCEPHWLDVCESMDQLVDFLQLRDLQDCNLKTMVNVVVRFYLLFYIAVFISWIAITICVQTLRLSWLSFVLQMKKNTWLEQQQKCFGFVVVVVVFIYCYIFGYRTIHTVNLQQSIQITNVCCNFFCWYILKYNTN